MYNHQLDVFIAVADCGSFTKASERLFISPTAVMKQINALESHLEIHLLNRTPRGIVLTEEGASIYQDAKKIIAQSEKALRRAREIAKDRQYQVRVGTSLMNPCKALMDLWKEVSGDHPNFHIKIVPYIDDSNGILHILDTLGSDFDFIVAPCDSKEWTKRCNFYQLGEYQVCCAVPHKHPLTNKLQLHIEDLHGQRLMMVQQGDSVILDGLRDWLTHEHTQIQLVDTPFFYDAEVLNRCEQEGNILLTLDSWKEVHPFMATIPVDWDYTMPYGLLYPLQPADNVSQFLRAIQTVRGGN